MQRDKFAGNSFFATISRKSEKCALFYLDSQRMGKNVSVQKRQIQSLKRGWGHRL